MAAMGSQAVFSREDFELTYGIDRTFSAALHYREYPMGQRDSETSDERARSYRYTLDGERLTISAQHWDEPLVCVRDCYNQAFVEFMDKHYRMTTSAEPNIRATGTPPRVCSPAMERDGQ